jgi:hypothetical protein
MCASGRGDRELTRRSKCGCEANPGLTPLLPAPFLIPLGLLGVCDAFSEHRSFSLSDAGCAVRIGSGISRRETAVGPRLRTGLVHQFQRTLRASARSSAQGASWGQRSLPGRNVQLQRAPPGNMQSSRRSRRLASIDDHRRPARAHDRKQKYLRSVRTGLVSPDVIFSRSAQSPFQDACRCARASLEG